MNCTSGLPDACPPDSFTCGTVTYAFNRLRQMTTTITSSELLATSLPDVPDRETIISELDGAAVPSSATVNFLIPFTLAQYFNQSMVIRLSPIGTHPLRQRDLFRDPS